MIYFLLGASLIFNLVFVVGLVICYKKISSLGLFDLKKVGLDFIFNKDIKDFDMDDSDFED